MFSNESQAKFNRNYSIYTTFQQNALKTKSLKNDNIIATKKATNTNGLHEGCLLLDQENKMTPPFSSSPLTINEW